MEILIAFILVFIVTSVVTDEGSQRAWSPGGRVLAALIYDSFISEAETPD